AVLSYQQLPVLPGKESHQKSVPLGWTAPVGERPMTLRYMLLRYDVDTAVGSQPGTGVPMTGPHTVASGTANSIMPRRQLSKKWLSRSTLSLPPANHRPVPTGAAMKGWTSDPAVKGLKL